MYSKEDTCTGSERQGGSTIRGEDKFKVVLQWGCLAHEKALVSESQTVYTAMQRYGMLCATMHCWKTLHECAWCESLMPHKESRQHAVHMLCMDSSAHQQRFGV